MVLVVVMIVVVIVVVVPALQRMMLVMVMVVIIIVLLQRRLVDAGLKRVTMTVIGGGVTAGAGTGLVVKRARIGDRVIVMDDGVMHLGAQTPDLVRKVAGRREFGLSVKQRLARSAGGSKRLKGEGRPGQKHHQSQRESAEYECESRSARRRQKA